MRAAALLCGLVAGLFVLLAPSALDLDLIGPFLTLWPAAEQLIGTVVWYAMPATALLGGILAVIAPGFAALLLLAPAIGWLAAGLLLPALFDYPLLVPAALAGLGAILAFVAGELAIRRRRVARRRRQPQPANEADEEAEEREAALRMDPLLVPRDRTAPQVKPLPLKLDVGEDDGGEELLQRSQPGRADPLRRDADPAWEQPDPLRRQPDPLRRDPGPMRRDPDPLRRDEVRWPEPLLSQPPMAVRHSPPPRRRGMVGWLVAINAVLIVGLGLGVGYALYADGRLANPFEPAPAAAPVEPSVPVAGEPEPETVAAPAAAAANIEPPQVTETPAASTAAAPVPSAVASTATRASYTDPFSYCSAVGTVDFVDGRYAGPPTDPTIVSALQLPRSAAQDRVHWRCVRGSVLACASYDGPVCDLTPRVTEMVEFCERNPNVAQLTAPNGTWACTDGKPDLPADASWPVDERGFYPPRWVKVPPPTG